MQLKDTIQEMISFDYKERFIAEYYQLKIRADKLNSLITKIEASNYSSIEAPEHDCPLSLLFDQLHQMRSYLHTLEIRAVIEGISLGN